jgi:hypothetical protein
MAGGVLVVVLLAALELVSMKIPQVVMDLPQASQVPALLMAQEDDLTSLQIQIQEAVAEHSITLLQ